MCVQLCKGYYFAKFRVSRYVYQKFCDIIGAVAENFENIKALLEFQSVQFIVQGPKLAFFRSHSWNLLMIFRILTLMWDLDFQDSDPKLQNYGYHFVWYN